MVASVSLFVALGGSGYAAVKINGSNLKNRSVSGAKLKKNAVTGTEVKNHSLAAADLKLGQLPAGPPGPRGPAGAPGPTGAPGVAAAFSAVGANTFRPFPNAGIGQVQPLATLPLPAGSYAISASFEAVNSSSTQPARPACDLAAGNDEQTQEFDVDSAATGNEDTVAMQTSHRFSASGDVTLTCTDFGIGEVRADNIRITAIQVASLSRIGF